VHATPWEARKLLLNNPRVPNILDQLTRLAEHGIQFHGQMVVVPGLNDGEVLEATLADLWNLGDAVITVAVVPVGLTQFNHLFKGESMGRDHASRLLAAVNRWGDWALEERGTRWVFGSDELYLLAGEPLPDASFYEDFPQIENGVGAVASLRARLDEGLESLQKLAGRRIGVVTGTAMAPMMGELVRRIEERTQASIEVIRTENSLFGPGVTTAGLLVGADMRRVLAPRRDLDLVLIPAESINDDGLFLDDDTFEALRGVVSMPILASYDFVDVLTGTGRRGQWVRMNTRRGAGGPAQRRKVGAVQPDSRARYGDRDRRGGNDARPALCPGGVAGPRVLPGRHRWHHGRPACPDRRRDPPAG
jgi:NifB/MoaA-like Fe-S oxidoreductase